MSDSTSCTIFHTCTSQYFEASHIIYILLENVQIDIFILLQHLTFFVEVFIDCYHCAFTFLHNSLYDLCNISNFWRKQEEAGRKYNRHTVTVRVQILWFKAHQTHHTKAQCLLYQQLFVHKDDKKWSGDDIKKTCTWWWSDEKKTLIKAPGWSLHIKWPKDKDPKPVFLLLNPVYQCHITHWESLLCSRFPTSWSELLSLWERVFSFEHWFYILCIPLPDTFGHVANSYGS